MSRAYRPLWATLTLVAAPALQAAEAPDLRAYLEHDWYRTEVVIFERPDVQDFRVTEALARDRERALPASMTSLAGPAPEPAGGGELLPAPSPFLPDARALDCVPWQPTAAPFTAADMPRLIADIERAMAREAAAADGLSAEGAPEDETPAGEDAIDTRDDQSLAPPGEAPADALFEPDPTLLAEGAPAAVPAPDPRQRLLEELAAWEATQRSRSYRWLGDSALNLRPHARQLARGGAHRILFHDAWQQPVPPREAPEPILLLSGTIPAADLYGPPVFRLQGTLSVTLGRFLHVAARLWLHEPAATLAPEALARPAAEGNATRHQDLQDRLARALEPRYFELDESRRLRSEELHYLDHPRFGVLLQVLPVAPPAELAEALQALDEQTD